MQVSMRERKNTSPGEKAQALLAHLGIEMQSF